MKRIIALLLVLLTLGMALVACDTPATKTDDPSASTSGDENSKVEIDPEYDMSAYEVYIYNGYGWTNLDPSQDLADIEPAKPDEYGYYTIGEVKGEHTVYVVGVVANETLLMVGNILDMVKNIFEMIGAFFAEILAFFGLAA
jgi:hypothetical protein